MSAASSKARPEASAPPEWEVVDGPLPRTDLSAVTRRCRQLVRRRALLAAGVATVPVPGLDWVTDVGILVRVLPQINEAFGLSEAQIARLAPDRRLVVYKAISAAGGLLVGRLITQDLVLKLVKLVGVRLTTQQAAKYVPLAGQAVSAALTYSALVYVCEQHIRQCLDVARQLQLPAPEPAQASDDAQAKPGMASGPGSGRA
jgi:uncharacterized protein (DUF697 family)